MIARAAAGLAALLLAAAAHAQAPSAPDEPIPVPKLAARVTDLAGTLPPERRAALERKLQAFEEARGSQVAVLVVPSIGFETIEEFAGRVADAWQLGRKGVDDGVLFAIAMQERKLRIHTGRGVQGTLTDALSKRIVADIVAPRFRAGDFAGGIDAGVDAIMKAIEGEALPLPERKAGPASPAGGGGFSNFLLLAFFLVPVVATLLRGIFGRFFGATFTSGLTGLAAWLLLGSLAIGIVAALFAFMFTLFGGMGMARTARRGGWGGVVIPGGGWGGGGGFGGGGGWGGGGGGFDGGGASGSW